MATRIEELESLATKGIRDLASRRAQATRQYADMLSDYGTGKIDAQEFGTKVMGLIAKEAFAYSGDTIEVSTSYWKGVAHLFDPSDSVQPRTATRQTETKPAKKKAKKKAKTTSKAR